MNKQVNVFQIDFDAVEREVHAFEQSQRDAMDIDVAGAEQWSDKNPTEFKKADRDTTTILFGGLTLMQDVFIQAACRGIGYRFQALECPDNESMQVGKEFGNRGQCNPTYFTVGNLVKYLIWLRDKKGLSVEAIEQRYLFVTAGACGPCRFGLYVTEYRKALRDAGFENFRVLLFQSKGGLEQGGAEMGLDFNPAFFRAMFKAIILGDVVNLVGYRIRPYEKNSGDVNRVLEQCRELIVEKLEANRNVMPALKQCKSLLDKVELDRLQPKPKVSVIGEFWAMTTEGDGNYHLQKFLEQEGAEVDVQPVTNWTLYMIWSVAYDIRQQLKLKLSLREKFRLSKKLLMLKLANVVMQRWFYRYAKAIGLDDYHLADMNALAEESHAYYANELRGGEGHMEVGKLIQAVKFKKAHLVVSVKPFGCMPSSGVSDGVQSLITGQYPEANFIAIETSGDGAVNVYSRIQMALFKARQRAKTDFDEAVKEVRNENNKIDGITVTANSCPATWYPAHRTACTAANILYQR